jgi:hypothetical protein
MVPKFIQLNGVTTIARHDMISRVKNAFLKGGGYILDFHMFSNISICINFEVPLGNIGALYSSRRETSLRLNQESHDLLAGCCAQLPGEKSSVAGTLQITFIHNEPDLRIECPPIPG